MNCKSRPCQLFILFLLPAFTLIAQGEAQLELNASASFELSRGGEKSHYYYNEIHEQYRNWRFGLAQANLMAHWRFAPGWGLQGRLLLERRLGQRPEQLQAPQLNLQWAPGEGAVRFTLGRFIHPFGAFNGRQLPTERDFIARPLPYSYYVNISEKAGFFPDMGDAVKTHADGAVQWGSTLLHYGGYATGLKLNWELRPQKAWLDAALVNGAANIGKPFTRPLRWGVASRLSVQPGHWWKQGFSLACGTFMEKADINAGLEKLRAFRQALIGTDFRFGRGYFELSGEMMIAVYRAPLYMPKEETFTTKNLNLRSFAGYAAVKYNLPFLGGAYLAYRLETLRFGHIPDETQKWDKDVLRHSLAAGYRVNAFLLVQTSVSVQRVKDRPWSRHQEVFRLMATAFY